MQSMPKWFTGTVLIALLWNLLGCMAFIADLRLSPADIARLPDAQQALYAARPAWSVIATGVAVFGGVLGCLALLVKRKLACPLLALSLLGILVQDLAMFVLSNGAALAGVVPVVLQAIVLLVGIGLVVLCRKLGSRGWLV